MVLWVFDRKPYLQIHRRSTRQSILETREATYGHSSSMQLRVSGGSITKIVSNTAECLVMNRIVINIIIIIIIMIMMMIIIIAFCDVILEVTVFVVIFLSLTLFSPLPQYTSLPLSCQRRHQFRPTFFHLRVPPPHREGHHLVQKALSF